MMQWKSFMQMVQITDGQIAVLIIEKVSMNVSPSILWTVTDIFDGFSGSMNTHTQSYKFNKMMLTFFDVP